MTKALPPCPCGSGQAYAGCCGPLHAGAAAIHAEALMRSRHSAYCLGLEDYLLSTWHPQTRPAALELAKEATKWLGLAVRRCQQHDANHASVEFVARYRVGGRGQRLHEISRFERLNDGRWYYLDGEIE